MEMHFAIPAWSSWVAAQSGVEDDTGADKPDVSGIPAMLRRRLNLLGRACASQALPFLDEDASLPIVYCSQHGDIERTLKVLTGLADTGEVSPKDFSLAVHNAICGVLSIQTGAKGAINSIAAGEAYLVPVLLEAIGMLSSQCPRVLCVVCDVPLPPVYRTEVSQPDRPFATAFIVESSAKIEPQDALENRASTKLSLRLTMDSGTSPEPLAGARNGLEFCDFLTDEQLSHFLSEHNGMNWALTKC